MGLCHVVRCALSVARKKLISPLLSLRTDKWNLEKGWVWLNLATIRFSADFPFTIGTPVFFSQKLLRIYIWYTLLAKFSIIILTPYYYFFQEVPQKCIFHGLKNVHHSRKNVQFSLTNSVESLYLNPCA